MNIVPKTQLGNIESRTVRKVTNIRKIISSSKVTQIFSFLAPNCPKCRLKIFTATQSIVNFLFQRDIVGFFE